MPPRYWVVITLAATAVHIWLLLHLDSDRYPVLSPIGIGVHLVACIGPFWMLFDWFIKNQQRKLKWRKQRLGDMIAGTVVIRRQAIRMEDNRVL